MYQFKNKHLQLMQRKK